MKIAITGAGKQSFLSNAHRDLRAGKRIRAVSDVWACNTYVSDLVRRIVDILTRGRHGTYHAVNEGVCSNYEFALEVGCLVGLSGGRLKELVEPIKEAETKRLAPRPRYTPMGCLLSEEISLPPVRDWRSALADYVQKN